MRQSTARPTFLRRVLALVLTVVLLVVAAQLNKLPDKLSRSHETTVVAMGQPGRIETAELTLTEVRLTKRLQTSSSDVQRTRGTFVVITGTLRQPGPETARVTTLLTGGGRTFRTSSSSFRADPSFEETTTLAFEVPTENLAGLKATSSPSSLILGYDEQLEFDLGLDQARIEAMLDRDAAGIELPSTSAVRGI